MNVGDELKHQLQSVIQELELQIPPVVSAYVQSCHLTSYILTHPVQFIRNMHGLTLSLALVPEELV